MTYIAVRGRWCDTVLNMHASTEDKSNDTKDSFYEELERVLDQFPKYHMNFARKFQCRSRDCRSFQTNNRE
jgi:hypothetical protein